MLIRPRLTDYNEIYVAQHEIDFAIPFLNEDIPLYVDPFLLWKSPSFQDKALHQLLLASFNNLGVLVRNGHRDQASAQLVAASECNEVGLGTSAKRTGKRISLVQANQIVNLFEAIPFYRDNGFRHFEEIQLFVDGIGKDRISDIACIAIRSDL